MNYHIDSHCPDCFQPSRPAVCAACGFDRAAYLSNEAATHHLPLFTQLKKSEKGDTSYILGRMLGEGGFAIVYAALREQDGLSFAVKEYYPETLANRGLDNCTVQPKRSESERLQLWQKRFQQEAEHLRRCQDYPPISGVVRFADLIKQHNTTYLVMERLQGNNLQAYLKTPKTAEWIIAWLKPLLETLVQLHNRQLFHRDISPNNIFLTEHSHPILMDFGLAREGIRDNEQKSSAIGGGTTGFRAPEQLRHAADSRIDGKTDFYAIGGVIYAALHGNPPPDADLRLKNGAPLNHYDNNAGLGAELAKLAEHCLQLDRSKRPEQVAMLKNLYPLLWQIDRLEKIQDETLVPTSASQSMLAIPINPAQPNTAKAKPQVDFQAEMAVKVKQNSKQQQLRLHDPIPNSKRYIYAFGLFLILVGLAVGLVYISKLDPPQPSPETQLQQAKTLLEGEDHSQWPTAVARLTTLADTGNAEAMRLLGFSYYNGVGVGKDLTLGCRWYQQAAKGNNQEAKEFYAKAKKCH
ncbi:hypothetical protein JCM14076_26660 [Methylosoma difficile]